MMLLGVLWAAFAPLLLLPLVAAVGWALPRGWSRRRTVAVAAAAVGLPVALLWGLAWREYDSVCRTEVAARVLARGQADGIYLNSATANSFGMRYLHQEGFAWVEAPDYRQRGGFVRYTRAADGTVTDTPIDAPTARHEVREVHSEPFPHTHLARTEVVDRATGSVMAHAGSASFDGGPARWVLGAWGSRSCPSVVTDPAGFNAHYHLARDVLRGAK